MNCCAVIPVYNHEHAVGRVVASVRAQGLHCILVDDGSAADCRVALEAIGRNDAAGVTLIRLPVNQGKGVAVLAGMQQAARLGFSHVLQLDADGQHDAAEIPAFLVTSAANPAAVVCGHPVYDESVPRARFYGRYATHVWVWINTLSFRLKDSMCGFRLYPVAPALKLAAEEPVGRRMDFDSEILVRLDWRAIPVINLPIRVHYPFDGVSHFDIWRDNVRISVMHARLFFGMLRRLPRLLARRFSRSAR